MSISFWNKNTHQETVLGGISGIFDRTKNGLVPQAPSGSGTSKYLREDGNWTVPPNDTKGNVISTYAAQSGAAQSAISTVINDDVHMDDAIKTLLNNDATLNSVLTKRKLEVVQKAIKLDGIGRALIEGVDLYHLINIVVMNESYMCYPRQKEGNNFLVYVRDANTLAAVTTEPTVLFTYIYEPTFT